MTIEEIRALRLADPFEPFALILDNGRRLVIDKPYGLAISPTKKFLLVPTVAEGAIWFSPDRVAQVLLLNKSKV
jgi:hypothetical protein